MSFSLRSQVCTLALMIPLSLFSQGRIAIPVINGQFRFDGIVDDECWNNAKPFPMVVQKPVFGAQPSEKTEVMICYDNDYLIVGARMFSPDPAYILSLSKKRDEAESLGDAFMLLLDTFNDKENGLGFATNPSGLRSDFTVSKDAMGVVMPNGEGPISSSWNTFWDVKTSQNELGWFVEMRIPFSSLRFKDDNGLVVMGMICARFVAHSNQLYIFPAIPPNWGATSHIRPSKGQEIIFEGLKSRKPFYVAPYIIGGKQWEQILNSEETGYELNPETKKLISNGGLDVKYGLTNNLTMDLTLNTDFAQVEADDEQINLTRFSLFMPEKRTFFQERSSIFSFDFEPQTSMFYSRNIGLYENDDTVKQVPIFGGARVTGMAGKWDIGFLDMQTQHITGLPSENFGIIRMRRNVINASSYIGGMLTTRMSSVSRNAAYGLDGIFKISENDYMNVKIARVSDSTRDGAFSADPLRLFFNWQRFTDKGLNYDATWTRSGKDFNPGIGFITRNDYTHYHGSIGYGWLPGDSSLLQNHKLGIMTSAYTDNQDNSPQTVETTLKYEFNMKAGQFGMMTFKHAFENVTDTFDLSRDSYVPPGKYSYVEFETHLNTSPSRKLRAGVDLWAGTYYGGRRLSLGFTPGMNIGSLLVLQLNYQQNFIHFSGRKSFTGGVAGLKVMLMMSTRLSASAFIQYNSSEHSAVTNLRLRYNPREGNDFYIVFNEGRNTYRDLEIPRLPVYDTRAVMLKYTYTFTL